jgi:hypothetical protein
MMICVDYHPSFQQIAFLVKETGEYSERRLNHSDGEAEKFYRDMQRRGVQVQVGWRRPAIPAGSNDCWQSWVSKCGSATRRRSRLPASRSKRPIAKMRNCC